MIVYADTSSIVKIYVTESQTAEVRRLLGSVDGFASSIVAYPEVRAALASAIQQARHSSAEHMRAVRDFERDWALAKKIDLDEPLARAAGDLAEQHGLRGFDAIHLASALTLQRELGEPVFFSAFDDRLVDAAVASGLSRP